MNESDHLYAAQAFERVALYVNPLAAAEIANILTDAVTRIANDHHKRMKSGEEHHPAHSCPCWHYACSVVMAQFFERPTHGRYEPLKDIENCGPTWQRCYRNPDSGEMVYCDNHYSQGMETSVESTTHAPTTSSGP